MHRLIPALLASAVLATSSAAQTIGPETSLAPTDRIPAASPGWSPRVVPTGDGYYAAWIDSRGGVYGARLDRHGNLLDPGGLHLGAPPMIVEYEMAVAPAGTDAMVVIAHSPSIEVLRVSANGTVTTLPSIGHNGPETGTHQIEMATNGATFLVVWQGLAELIDRDGRALAGPFATGITAGLTQRLAVASNGDGYLIAGFTDGGDGVVLPVTGDASLGTLRKLNTTILNPREVTLASDGSRYILVSAGNGSLEATIVQPDGSLGRAASFGDGASASARLAWNGREYVVAVDQFVPLGVGLHTAHAVRLIRLDADGHALSAFTTLDGVSNIELAPIDLVGTADGALVTWASGGAFTESDIVLAAAISDATIDGGTAPAPIALSESAPSQRETRLIRTDRGMAAIWREAAGRTTVLEGVPLDSGGRPRAIPVSFDQVGPNPLAFKVAFDGKSIVVAWADLFFSANPSIFMARYTAELQPIDSNPLVVTTTGSADFDLSAGGGVALVAWSAPHDEVDRDIRVAFVQTGDFLLQPLLGTIYEVPGRGVSNVDPALAWNGHEFLVSWWTRPVLPLPYGRPMPDALVGARVTADGRLLDRAPLTIATPDLPHVTVAAASNGNDFYVVWGANAYSAPDLFVLDTIYGARVGGDGATAGSKGDRVSPADVRASQPSVTGHGSDFLVAWNEVASRVDSIPRLGISLIGNGANPPIAKFDTAKPYPSSDAPSIAASDANVVVSYGRLENEPPYNGVLRVFTRMVAGPPLRRRSKAGNP
jgi:hypothetical protein